MLRASELAMPCLNTSITLVAPADRWQQMLDECLRSANLAAKTGTQFLRIFGGGIPKDMTRDEARVDGATTPSATDQNMPWQTVPADS